MLFLGLTSLLCLSSHVFAAESAASPIKNIKICDDNGEWPPYVYYELKDGKKSEKLIGYAVDVMDEITTRSKITYKLEMLPWKGCLDGVKNNSEGLSMLLEFSKNADREKDFIFPTAFYTTKSAIFFDKKKHKDGLQIKSLADLKKYKGCGITGYNYKDYGLTDADLDLGAKSIDQIATKVKAGRCDFFIEKFEVVAGFEKTGGAKVIGDPEIGYEYLTMVPPSLFYMGISRKYPQAKELETLINKELDAMEKDGTLKKLEKKWVGG